MHQFNLWTSELESHHQRSSFSGYNFPTSPFQLNFDTRCMLWMYCMAHTVWPNRSTGTSNGSAKVFLFKYSFSFKLYLSKFDYALFWQRKFIYQACKRKKDFLGHSGKSFLSISCINSIHNDTIQFAKIVFCGLPFSRDIIGSHQMVSRSKIEAHDRFRNPDT